MSSIRSVASAVPGHRVGQQVAQQFCRFIRRPNYAVVIVEMFTIPVFCGAYFTAAIFSLANALLLARRIPEEERALEQASSQALPRLPRFLPRIFRL